MNPLKSPIDFTFDVISQIDPNDDAIENIAISLSGLVESFMTWKDDDKSIKFTSLGVEEIGTYRVDITIKDPQGASTT